MHKTIKTFFIIIFSYICAMAKKNGNIHPTRIFKEPNELFKAFQEYKDDILEQSNEWQKVQYVGKEAERVTDGQKVPYTQEGFERFCYNKYGCVEQYFKNQDGLYDDFIPISTRIKKEIRENQIIGGMLGFYKESITARINNLKEQVQTEIQEQALFPDNK